MLNTGEELGRIEQPMQTLGMPVDEHHVGMGGEVGRVPRIDLSGRQRQAIPAFGQLHEVGAGAPTQSGHGHTNRRLPGVRKPVGPDLVGQPVGGETRRPRGDQQGQELALRWLQAAEPGIGNFDADAADDRHPYRVHRRHGRKCGPGMSR